MAWLELHQTLRRHPKLLHLARLLKVDDPDFVRAKLENIWLWCLDHAEQGVVIINDRLPIDVWVKEAAGWSEKQGGGGEKADREQGSGSFFADALLESGWIEKVGAGSWGYKLQVHDWHDYAGRLMEQRRIDKERKRAIRSAGRLTDGDSTVPYRTQPNRTQPEEEEGATPPPPPAPPPSPSAPEGTPERPASEVDRDFPLGGGTFPMSEELQKVFDGAIKTANPKPEPTPQDSVTRILLRAAVDVAKMPNKPATIRPALEAMRARYGAQRVEEWLMHPDNVGKNTIEMQDELKILHKGDDVAAKIKLKTQNERRSKARSEVLSKIVSFLKQHAPKCPGCRDCARDREMLRQGGVPESEIPGPAPPP